MKPQRLPCNVTKILANLMNPYAALWIPEDRNNAASSLSVSDMPTIGWIALMVVIATAGSCGAEKSGFWWWWPKAFFD